MEIKKYRVFAVFFCKIVSICFVIFDICVIIYLSNIDFKCGEYMKKYQFLYPAIFVRDEDGSYQVIFPDLNIYTDGRNMSEAYLAAKDLLLVYFSYAVKYEMDFNKPTKAETLMAKCKPNETVMYIDAYVKG